MPYSLYSHNRLLGETGLEYHTDSDTVRMGAFRPTDTGDVLMPVLTGVQRVYHDMFLERDPVGARSPSARSREAMHQADLAAAQSHFDALELELRAPDGTVLRAEWISVQDTDELTRWTEQMEAKFPERFAVGDDAALEAAVAHDMELIDSWFDERENGDGPWEADEERGEFPRYQITVELADPL